MKKLTLLAAAALTCCSYSTTFAQVQILRATGPAAAPRLVSEQTPLDDRSSDQPTSPSNLESAGAQVVRNPFDYFAEDLPTGTPQVVVQDDSSHQLSEDNSPLENAQSGTSFAEQDLDLANPATLPVGRHHRHQRSIVDTIVEQAAIGNVPHVNNTAIAWCAAPQTPNPVAEWLLREECVAGLWDGYAQRRAAECAQMRAHLSGHCGHCGSGGCATAPGPCNACTSPQVRNRYLTGPADVSQACGSCNGL